MRYSIDPIERRHAKGYGFLSFARNLGTHKLKLLKIQIINIVKSLLILLKNLQKMH